MTQQLMLSLPGTGKRASAFNQDSLLNSCTDLLPQPVSFCLLPRQAQLCQGKARLHKKGHRERGEKPSQGCMPRRAAGSHSVPLTQSRHCCLFPKLDPIFCCLCFLSHHFLCISPQPGGYFCFVPFLAYK